MKPRARRITDLVMRQCRTTSPEVVVYGQLVTSREPDDTPAFNREIKRLFSF
jgi:putative intracellular protease/amidase